MRQLGLRINVRELGLRKFLQDVKFEKNCEIGFETKSVRGLVLSKICEGFRFAKTL